MTLLLIPDLQHFGSPVVIYFLVRNSASPHPLVMAYPIRKYLCLYIYFYVS